jgi:hypothetical protein
MLTILELIDAVFDVAKAELDSVDQAFAALGGNDDPGALAADLLQRYDQLVAGAWRTVDERMAALLAAYRDRDDVAAIELVPVIAVAQERMRDARPAVEKLRRTMEVAVSMQVAAHYRRTGDQEAADSAQTYAVMLRDKYRRLKAEPLGR